MRYILKVILENLSKIAIKKHKISVIVVNGWLGVEIVKEGIYSVLEEKFIVRRNTRPVWWDMSIPLNILGYKDKQRTFIEWISVIIRSIVVLLFGQVNPHTLILSANSERKRTAEYWSGFLRPELLVIINHKQESPVADKLIESTISVDGTVVYKKYDFDSIPKKNSFTYAKKKSDVEYKTGGSFIELKYRKKRIKYKNFSISPYEPEILATIFAASKKTGLSFEDVVAGISKFDYRNVLLQKISDSI